ncbi:voltage-dependent T-type calcium channel subunit alpha-1H-like [Fundulus heteroclitus]|uniref:voltage-dependent T-type calcium channel subunit alpha-1H-like n=1 Tax=Fundulus heteroclitus TaxID=8078 RepID=UPI00165BB3BD|nr:voltage-dependent T-type calcium channel subunit alpha-1H-like [Fundulus heteroclitus]
MRILRFANIIVPKTWKMIVLFKTIIWTFLEVGNLNLLLTLFCIYAVVGVELFGKLECSPDFPCLGPNRHTSFESFRAALLSLCHVSIGYNMSAIIEDTMRTCHGSGSDCSYSYLVSLTYFGTFLSMFHVMFVKLVVAWRIRTAPR